MPASFSVPSTQNEALCAHNTCSFTYKLAEFGLNETEAHLYVHLLKYGPKRAGELARSLKTYRLDVYRKLASLVDKSMVNVRKESPSVYTAVDLDKALDSVLFARRRELRWMNEIKAQLLELLSGAQPLPQNDSFVPLTVEVEDDNGFIKLLNVFGLRKKEAQLYVHLLKYGPRRVGDLTRSLKTYREDVYRRCARLIDLGLAQKVPEDGTRYAPAKLDEALDAALAARHQELYRLHAMKQKLVQDANAVFGHPENNRDSFKVLNTVGNVMTAISQLINSAETSVFFVARPRFNLFSTGAFLDHLGYAVERGVNVRGVFNVERKNLPAARELLDCGVELRHCSDYGGVTMIVGDGTRSVSLIHADLTTALSLDEKIAALQSDSVVQAEFLNNAFEKFWNQAITANERIMLLLQQASHPQEHAL